MNDQTFARRRHATTEEESLDRIKRIETRITALSVALGVPPPGTSAPTFKNGVIKLPSAHSSMQEVLDAIPETWAGPVTVQLRDRVLARLEPVREQSG